MPENFDDRVTIEEPPIQQITKKRSCFKRTCSNACGCLILLIIGSLIFLKLAARPSDKTLDSVPEALRQTVPIYDERQVFRIEFSPGAESKQKFEVVTFFPKLIVSPIVVHFPHRFGDKGPYTTTSTKKEIFYGFMRQPIGETRDIYTLEWKNISTSPQFIAAYYQTEMEKKNFILDYDQYNGQKRQLLFSNPTTLVSVIIQDPDHRSHDTEHIFMTISQNISPESPSL